MDIVCQLIANERFGRRKGTIGISRWEGGAEGKSGGVGCASCDANC